MTTSAQEVVEAAMLAAWWHTHLVNVSKGSVYMTGGENRRRSILKALRKRRLDREIYCYLSDEHRYYNNLHQYSKNKIHCSCPMCASKTRGSCISRFKRIISGANYKISDVRKIQRLEYQDEE